MSSLKINGTSMPVVGVKEIYSVLHITDSKIPQNQLYNDNSSVFENQIKWFIYVLDRGNWRLAKGNEKTGETVDFTFTQTSLKWKEMKMIVHAYGQKAMIDIKPQKASQGKILYVELLDKNYTIPTRPFAYGDWIIARVHCVDMERFPLTVTLWEDDGNKTRQNTTNVKIETKKGAVINGTADVAFYLNPSHMWLANAKLAPGDKNEGEFHEYYVTAEIFEKVSKRTPSKNANIPNPDYKPEIPKQPIPAEQKGPSKKETKGIAKSDKKVHDYHEQKVAVKKEVWKDPFIETINSLMTVNVGDSWWKKEDACGCNNCIASVTAAQLVKIFTNTDYAVLEIVAKIYTKYMKELGMDTCWNKAHFFAQAVVESGKELKVSGQGEGFNYSADDLHLGRWNKQKTKRKIIFSYFASHREEAYKYGRIKELRNGRLVTVQSANEEMIAKLAYGPNSAKGKELGNTQPNDGWDLRGRGLVQLTGRSGYEYANAYTKREGSDIIKNPDLIVTNVAAAVLSSMAFFKWKGITKIANEKIYTEAISKRVGNDVQLANGKRNHAEKQEVFTKNTAIVFEINKCKYGEDQNATDLKIQQGTKWLESIAIDQGLAEDKLNYKVLYSNDRDRTSTKGEDTMDCSELVCRYLQKIEWSSKVLSMNTSGLYNYAKNNSKWLEKHDSTDYDPKIGDIFIWKNDAGSMGHTGIVINFDKTTNIVTTIEAISSTEQPEGLNKSIKLQGVVKLKWKKLSKHLINHPVSTARYTASACRFYTPKIHYSKQDKK